MLHRIKPFTGVTPWIQRGSYRAVKAGACKLKDRCGIVRDQQENNLGMTVLFTNAKAC